MRCSTVSTLMMAALIGEAVAGPTHAHLHRRAHQKKDVDWESLDWANMDVDWKSAYAAGQATSTTAAPVAVATPTVAVAKAAATTKAAAASSSAADTVSASSVVSDIVDDISDLWDGLVGASNSRKAFGSATSASGSLGDHYRGNYGSPYGSNIIKVSSTSGYDFTNTFINTGSKSMTINIWNKIGSDLQDLSGSALAPKDTTLTFVLAPGKSQIVAFQDNTQTAWAQACDDFTASGAYATVWGEAQFRSEGSGFDYSAILSKNSNNYDMTISSEENDCVSSRTENFWLAEYTPIGNSDGSCYVPGSTMHLTTKMGGVIS
ncbi:hypothetical protein IFR04_011532 [Cadophora malorum]|uniref:Allergen Asp f 4 n=1 Tax=Cadophora malorum TaxID=108018 RepID=A0A8H7TAJ7_9HELO|nr:hypothetical protein IFR04_011532 [Cadophora malorum]